MGSTSVMIGWFTDCAQAAEGEGNGRREWGRDNEIVNGWRRMGKMARLFKWRGTYCTQTKEWPWCNFPWRYCYTYLPFTWLRLMYFFLSYHLSLPALSLYLTYCSTQSKSKALVLIDKWHFLFVRMWNPGLTIACSSTKCVSVRLCVCMCRYYPVVKIQGGVVIDVSPLIQSELCWQHLKWGNHFIYVLFNYGH